MASDEEAPPAPFSVDGGISESAYEPSVRGLPDVERACADYGSNWNASEKGSEAAWYREVEMEASPSVVSVPAKAGGMSASSRTEFVGDVSSIVRAAHQRLEVPGPKQVWENDFWETIFQPAADPFKDFFSERFERPAQSSSLFLDPGAANSKPERSWLPLVGSSFLQAVKHRDPVSWRAKREKEMEEALELWEAFMLSWPSHLAVVSQLASLSESAKPRMVRDLLGHKAPSTLLKRYRALRGYFDYLSGFHVSFPGSESDCYGYLCHLQDKGKAASARKGVLEALAFARFVIGLIEVGNLNESRRCHGNAKVVSNRDREQASALKVSELQRLHHALEHDPSLWNRVFSGCCGKISCILKGSFGITTPKEILLSLSAPWTSTRPEMPSSLRGHSYPLSHPP